LKKLVAIIFCYLQLEATIVSNEFVKNDLDVLRDFDIEASYIKNDKFQSFYDDFSQKNQKHYINGLNQGKDIIPEVSQILKKNNVPSVFLYMAMAESNFLLKAKSKQNALGLWQFMPGTASEMGLRRNKYVDERMDFVKSTEAAVKYLTKLHGIFGSWYLAALSYNCGDGRLIEGITRATIDLYCKENDCSRNPKIQQYKKILRDYEAGKVNYKAVNEIYNDVKTWKYKPTINELLVDLKGSNKPYVPKESQNYIKKIISLAMMNNDNGLKINNTKYSNRGNNTSLVKVDVGGGTLLKNIANLSGITTDKLKQLNPQLKDGETPPSELKTQIYLPSSTLIKFNENKKSDNLQNQKDIKILKDDVENIDSDYLKTYTVQKGDNLYKIARENKTTMDKIMKDNNLKTNKVKPGDKIVIQNN
jgi:membrane-bound lytic murein transglycosylase D